MARHFGIDTSVLVRLLTRNPAAEFERCVMVLRTLVEHDDAELFASNQVIGEAYVAVQYHYHRASLEVLTLDRWTANLPQSRLL